MSREEKQEINLEKKPTRKRLTGSSMAKIVAFFLLAISFIVGATTGVVSIYFAQAGAYDYGFNKGLENLKYELMRDYAIEDAEQFYYLRWPEDIQELEQILNEHCEGRNSRMEVWRRYTDIEEDAKCILSNYSGFDTPYTYTRGFWQYETIEVEVETDKTHSEYVPEQTTEIPEGAIVELEETNAIGTDVSAGATYIDPGDINEKRTEYKEVEVYYTIKVYVNPTLAEYDEYKGASMRADYLWQYRNVFPVVALSGIVLCIICFIFLMCSAGHKNGRSGIVPGVLTPIHFDVLTVIFGFIAILGVVVGVEVSYNFSTLVTILLVIAVCTVVLIWCTIYCMEAALRLKMGQWWKHSLIYVICRMIWRACRFLWRSFVTLIRGLPLVINTAIIFMGICIIEFMLFLIWGMEDGFVIWVLEKIIFFPAVLYIALVCKKLLEGSEELAKGNLTYKLDTSKMVLDFKEHGENLNRIGNGIANAVEERMKSEHLKTELITNVSHDLKTPLTSIINYADLLGNVAGKEEHLSQEKVAEYSEVLLRQSKRLKKLLEDLVEASKATTGNLDVNMEKCEVGVLLSQAVGEYEQRFWEKQLELITRQPEGAVWIMADGRRLWRVFDNLLNNICKYAQESTRVYLTVVPKEGQVEIIFRNMSKYPLDMTGEELEERFARGDKSRHMEGNGLGLSIAKSLVELQNGRMNIVTDGDLFKVTLQFPVI